jgi:hypothetical protein
MIELNKKTQQDFLNREWVQRLLDAGVDMSDAKYIIAKDKLSMNDDEPDLTDYVWYKDSTAEVYDICPTYSTAELLYKLNEWPSIKLSEEKYIGARLDIFKDAPFYFACYYFGKTEKNDEYRKYDIECSSEYPIEAMAQLLIASAKSNFHNFKYVEDISNK